MSAYWPAWAGALGLAGVTIFYTLTTNRWFGLSGMWDRVLHWRQERELERLDEQFADDDELVEALARATAEEFGTSAVATGPAPRSGPSDGNDGAPTTAARPARAAATKPAPLLTQAALIVSMFVGSVVAAALSGRLQLRLDMGDGFRDLVTANPVGMIVVLFLGGVLVGFGTRLAGGCSSGHGLSGCGRLQPASLVATAVFFAAAAAVSFLLLWKVI